MADQQGPVRDHEVRELALFAGAGGGILGGKILGWRCICAVERDRYAAAVLAARQNDQSLAPFPIWDDVATFDGRAFRGRVDVVSAGFPCQDISAAGNGAGIDGAKSGLWRHAARIIRDIQPGGGVAGKQPNAHFSRTWTCSRRPGRNGVRCGMGCAGCGGRHLPFRRSVPLSSARPNVGLCRSFRRLRRGNSPARAIRRRNKAA